MKQGWLGNSHVASFSAMALHEVNYFVIMQYSLCCAFLQELLYPGCGLWNAVTKKFKKRRDREDNGVMQQTKQLSPCQAQSCWLLSVCLKKVQPVSLVKYSAFLSNRLLFLNGKSSQRWAKQFQSNRMNPLAFMKHTVNRVHRARLRPWS